jgi:hypothetical protein
MGGFGGVYNDWYLYTNNSVFADSSPRNCLMDSEVYDEGNNIDSGTSCGFYEASSEENEDPLLGPLANNGGPTMTHALMKGSPAIDAAAAGCPEPVDYYGDPYVIPGGWPRDQRGAMRPVGDGCDIGAFEAGGAPPTPTPAPTPPGTQRTFGDINCNGPADSVDSLVIQRDLASLPISQTQPCPGIGEIVDIQDASKHPWGDVDCDGDVDTVDSLKLLRFVAALSVQQEEGCPEIGATVLVQK